MQRVAVAASVVVHVGGVADGTALRGSGVGRDRSAEPIGTWGFPSMDLNRGRVAPHAPCLDCTRYLARPLQRDDTISSRTVVGHCRVEQLPVERSRIDA